MAGQIRMEKVLLHDTMVNISMADDDASLGGGMPYTRSRTESCLVKRERIYQNYQLTVG